MKITETLKSLVPSRSVVWTAIGAGVLTVAAGFTLAGWKTGGAADRMARDAATAARVDLASQVCAANFAATPAAFEQREEMLALSSFRQRSFVQEQPWALLPGENSVHRSVAEKCALLIAEMEPEAFAILEEAAEDPVEQEVDPG